MKVMKVILIMVMFLTFALPDLLAQDPQFSQFYATPLYLSPSYAGTVKKSRIILNNRIQWASLPQAYTTYSISGDHNYQKKNFGVGFIITRDVAGEGRLAQNTFGLLYAYRLQIKNIITFRPGIGFYYTLTSVDFLRNTFFDQINQNGTDATSTIAFIPANNQRGYPDGSASLLVHTSNIWFGFTADHLLRQNKSLIRWIDYIQIKYTAYGGVKIPLATHSLFSTGQSISTSFLYKRQGYFNQLDLSMIWSGRPYMVGLSYRGIPFLRQGMDYYRATDALVLHVGYTFRDFTCAYSYDFTISKLNNSSGGSHEFSLIYDLSELASPKRKKAIPCPRVY
jgi:type IX secretion system PorP/SprF family membrane protein